ncbi:ABC transporter ATP-binding protein [Apilactobacillus kunkeei]|uniref:Putative drug ABC exporter, ATP-binding subunit n=1 Tax=Apilactobacillus kunkeei TaxID=148814 RepID=A0A0P7K1P4_9LACO|nr:ABC transporter ATP-binding protein [Apilactobacillus kunkeei]KPN80194.1 putative drug ABC exporter, ATP-binding subunit [Apilactobacillus kunkeei]
MLEVNGLTKRFKNKIAVDHIDLQINDGQLVAFLGHNGAGKSTTINMLIGLLKPDAGEIQLNGLTPNDKNYNDSLGVVFQNSVLDKSLSVEDNLKIAGRLYKNFDADFQKDLLDKLEIKSIQKQKYGSLSGGQRRRVDIARALLSKPKLLFLDEPSTGLDIQTRNKIWEVLNELRHEMGLTIILTTHYLEEADQSDWVYVLDKGKIVASDTVDNLKARYAQNTLILYANDLSTVDKLSMLDDVKVLHNKVLLKVNSYQEAISIIEEYKNDISDFEYIHGSMDDIFIALTGKEIK